MAVHVTQHRGGFGPGLTPITRFDEAEDNTGIEMSIHKLAAGEEHAEVAEWETAWLLMSGEAAVAAGGVEARFRRRSLFDESASSVHVAAGESVRIRCLGDAEFAVFRAANRKRFGPRAFRPEDVPNEHRGAGQMGGACLRFVRTIFDDRNSDPNADLVLGEVVTLPGRWSSYPPHHHPQPEIYHYRFTRPEGFGFAQLGERVLRVRANDTVKIFPPQDHSQCAAPGYGMYYAWVIRHLPGNRYSVPEFTAEHRWTMEPGAPFWQPADFERHG
jgi:5-deoxy-glucuronate isomerase